MSRVSSGRSLRADRDPDRDRAQRAALEDLRRGEVARAKEHAKRVHRLIRLHAAFEGEHPRELQLHVAGICRMGRDAASRELDNAARLRDHYPQALRMLARGEIYVRTVEILLEVTRNASGPVQQELGRRVLPQIADWDAVDVRRRVSEVLPQVESEFEEAAQRYRHERAKANRGVWILPIEDGMARIGVETDLLSAARFATSFEEIDRAEAERDRRDGVKRTAGQRRADLLSELPARYLALAAGIQQGSTDELLAEAAARNAAAAADRGASALGIDVPSQDELPLGIPPAGPARAWQLTPFELQVQLLRVPVNTQVVLNVHVSATTVLELDKRALRLDMAGYHYLPAFHARMLLPDSGLRRVLVDPTSGIPVAVEDVTWPAPDRDDEAPLAAHSRHRQGGRGCACPHRDECDPPPTATRSRKLTPQQRADRQRDRALRQQQRWLMEMLSAYFARDTVEPQHDPSPGLKEFVQLRDQTSRGIGSNSRARGCDLDHRTDHALGGPTSADNLDAEDKRAHHSKDSGWVPSKDETTGVVTWTSPLGFAFTRQPVWDPPAPVADGATLPTSVTQPCTERDDGGNEPSDSAPGRPEVQRDREEPLDLPLWRDPKLPPPPKPGRSRTGEQIAGYYEALPPRPDAVPRRKQWGDDGPPLF